MPAIGLSPPDGETSIVDVGSQSSADPPDPHTPVVQPVATAAVNLLPNQSVLLSRAQPAPKFPTNTRQRGSNIAALDPEVEFQKVALDSCRSTIIQQEAEIKKLSEGIDIRNKKIMQLESQVGVAAKYVSSRDSSTADNLLVPDQPASLLATMNLLLTKVSSLADHHMPKTPAVNIYNTVPCSHQRQVMLDKDSQTHDDPNTDESLDRSLPTATDAINKDEHGPIDTEIVLVCTVCSQVLNTNEQLDLHMESVHGSSLLPFSCNNCVATFPSLKDLNTHQSVKHPAPYIKCSLCKIRVQNKSQLELHVKDCHGSPPSLARSSQPSSANVTASSTCSSPTGRDL